MRMMPPLSPQPRLVPVLMPLQLVRPATPDFPQGYLVKGGQGKWKMGIHHIVLETVNDKVTDLHQGSNLR